MTHLNLLPCSVSCNHEEICHSKKLKRWSGKSTCYGGPAIYYQESIISCTCITAYTKLLLTATENIFCLSRFVRRTSPEFAHALVAFWQMLCNALTSDSIFQPVITEPHLLITSLYLLLTLWCAALLQAGCTPLHRPA